MQKVTKFLEAYVQWVVVSLGVLWVLWMGYSYWANDPASTDVGKKVTAGDVDDELLKSTPVDSLDKAYHNELPYPESLKVALTTQTAGLVDKFKFAAKTPGTYPEIAEAPFTGGIQQAPPTPIENNAQNAALAALPDVKGTFALSANAEGLAVKTGMSVVNRPDPTLPLPVNVPNGQQAPNTIVPPDVNLVAQQQAALNPGATAPNPNGPAPVAVPPIVIAPEEVTWVTVSGTLDMRKLAAAFQKANIPQTAAFTSMLRVELLREEQQPDGSWKADSKMPVIPNLMNEFIPAMVPATPANPQEQGLAAMYLTWANSHVADVVEPPFYDYLRGDPWRTANTPDAIPAVDPAAVFDPAQVKPGDLSKLTPEQVAIYRKWKAQQDADAQKNRQPPRAPTGGGTGGRPGRGGPSFAPLPPGGEPGMDSRRPGRGGAPAVNSEARNPGGYQPGTPAAGAGVTPQDLPQAPFSPAQQQKDLEIWAHDETTVPGKVYHYKLRIMIKNPLFLTTGMAKNPADADVFALVTETDWSKPVNSPSKRDFFVSNGGTTIGGVPKVGIEYFKWEDGEWKQSMVTLQPGDRVGDTPWTIVDLRATGNSAGESRVVLVSDSGEAATRFYKTDKVRPEYKKLHDLLKPAALTPGAPGQTGQPTPPPPPGRGGGGGAANG